MSLWSIVLIPLAAAIFLTLTVGLAYFISALAVFVPDVRNVVQLFFAIGLFLHPILYPPDAPPAAVANAFAFSPFSHLVWAFRDAAFVGEISRPVSWLIAAGFAGLCFVFGYRFFAMLKPTFGSAL